MENNTNETTKMNDEQLDQVKGGAAYIKFDGVDGECKDKDHKGWSDLMSVSFRRR